MYLTKIVLNARNRQVVLNYNDVDYWHKNIMSGFMHTGYEGKDKRSHHNVLFRMADHKVYVTSDVEPLYENKSWIESVETKELSSVINSFCKGACYNFDLLCTPSRQTYDGVKNTFVWHKDPVDKRDWLINKGKHSGFKLVSYMEDVFNNVELCNVGGRGYTVKTTRMLGTLQITDVEKFERCYHEGLGREKSYGVGMLMLTR